MALVPRVRCHSGRTCNISRLALLAGLIPLSGIVLKTKVAWFLAFAFAGFWLIRNRKETVGGLLLLWGVQVEPAPCDILLAWACFKRALSGKMRWPASKALHLLLLFILFSLLQLPLVGVWKRGLLFTGFTVYTMSLAFLFSVIPGPSAWRELRDAYLTATWVAAGTILVLATMGLLGWAGHLSELFYDTRPRGFFKDPNVAGFFIATGALFALNQIVFRQRKLMGRAGALLVFSTLGAVLTFSRGVLINLAAGALVSGLVAARGKRGWRFAWVILIGIVMSLVIFRPAVESFGQASRFLALPDYDRYGRLAAWKAALLLAHDYPWGLGPGQFEIYSPGYQGGSTGSAYITPSAHSLYLRVLAENNLVGLGVLLTALALVLLALGKGVRLAMFQGDDELLADGAWLVSALAGILMQSFFIDTLHWRHFWILVGFAIAYRRLVVMRARGGTAGGLSFLRPLWRNEAKPRCCRQETNLW